jgi:hypothetical protein
MRYVVRNADEAGSTPIKRLSAKSAWLAARRLRRQGARNVAIFDREGNSISIHALAATAADEMLEQSGRHRSG